jgi:hypothetical protein
MIITIDVEKNLWQNSASYHEKSLQETSNRRIEDMYVNTIKATCNKSIINNIQNREKLQTSPFMSEMRPRHFLLFYI